MQTVVLIFQCGKFVYIDSCVMVYDWCIYGLNRKYQQLYSGNGFESSSGMAKYQPQFETENEIQSQFLN